MSEGAASNAEVPDFRFKQGGGYCFQKWIGNQNDPEKHRIPDTCNDTDEFSEWRQWMKEYLKKNDKEKKPKTLKPDSKTKDLAWNTHVQHAREVQKFRAHELAGAVVSSRQERTRKMFQQRFERSEKFALVSEPGDRRPRLPPSNEKKELAEAEKIEEVCTADIAEENEKNPDEEATDEVPSLEISTLDNLSLSSIIPSHEALLVSPQPWMYKADPVPPPPPRKNFNRSPRGFVGSYVTSYY